MLNLVFGFVLYRMDAVAHGESSLVGGRRVSRRRGVHKACCTYARGCALR
jgi:hypothetical protein